MFVTFYARLNPLGKNRIQFIPFFELILFHSSPRLGQISPKILIRPLDSAVNSNGSTTIAMKSFMNSSPQFGSSMKTISFEKMMKRTMVLVTNLHPPEKIFNITEPLLTGESPISFSNIQTESRCSSNGHHRPTQHLQSLSQPPN